MNTGTEQRIHENKKYLKEKLIFIKDYFSHCLYGNKEGFKGKINAFNDKITGLTKKDINKFLDDIIVFENMFTEALFDEKSYFKSNIFELKRTCNTLIIDLNK